MRTTQPRSGFVIYWRHHQHGQTRHYFNFALVFYRAYILLVPLALICGADMSKQETHQHQRSTNGPRSRGPGHSGFAELPAPIPSQMFPAPTSLQPRPAPGCPSGLLAGQTQAARFSHPGQEPGTRVRLTPIHIIMHIYSTYLHYAHDIYIYIYTYFLQP